MKKSRVVFYFILVLIFFFFNFYYRPIEGNNLIDNEYKNSSSYVNDLYMSNEYFRKSLLSETDYPLYYAVIQESLKNNPSVSLECLSDCDSFSTVVDAVILDHPELISFQIIGSWKISDRHIIYRNDYNLNRIFASLGARRIAREIDCIKRETKGMSDQEKIIYVYDYVASHNYDRGFTWSSSNQSAYSFFTKGTTVCAGFAKASQLILQNVGIQSYLVFGHEHMWNYVEYDGKYYVFDATVGASYYDKKSPHYYDGLGSTTVDETMGDYEELYPPIEKDKLRDIFGL